MSLSNAWYVTCDRCSIPAPISCENVSTARNIAHSEGFTQTRHADGGRLDLCKNCSLAVAGGQEVAPISEEQRAERERQLERARTCSYPDKSGYRCCAELSPDGFCDDATHRPSGVGEVATP